MRPKLITFDVTGTVLKPRLEYYISVASKYGLSINTQKLTKSFQHNFQRLNSEHPIYGKHTGLGWQNWWQKIIHNVVKDQYADVPQSTLDNMSKSLIAHYGKSDGWHIYPGAINLLRYIQQQGMILGVISNFDPRLESVLLDAKIRDYFSFVLISWDLGYEKPHLLVFNEALQIAKNKLGANIKPQEAIHIGDSFTNDYMGAKNANWNAFLIQRNDNHLDPSQISPKNVFKNFSELQLHFEHLFS